MTSRRQLPGPVTAFASAWQVRNGASAFSLALVLIALGCTPPLKPDLHYVLGKPYRIQNIWYYPRETFDLDETGLATVTNGDAARLTTDGEVFDQTALAGAHPSIQLPAIARLTNLENGREVTIRLNDRGAGDPHRLLEITRRTASLLAAAPERAVQVRLRVLPNESHAAADDLPGAPSLGLTAAPRGGVEMAELPPPPGVRQGIGHLAPVVVVAKPADVPAVAPPMRLPEVVTQTTARAGRLMVQLDTFDENQYAVVQRARMAAAGARIVTVANGRTRRFRVEIGPLPDIARADSVLNTALASGIPGARIVVH